MTEPSEPDPDRPPGDPDEAARETELGPELPEPTGMELARRIARSVAAGRGRPRRKPRRGIVEPQVSGSRPDDRDPQTLGETVGRLMAERGWSRQVTVHVLLGRWPALVGPVNAAHTQPEGYTEGVVTVRADSTAWATQLRQLAPQLIATLNDQLGDGTVTRINVIGPQGPSWKKGRLSTRNSRGPRDTYG